jgi:hypothetical protein
MSGTTVDSSACGACVCSEEVPSSIVTLIRDVPVNLQVPLPVLAGESTEPRIERVLDSAEVPSSVTRITGASDYWWLAVQADLEPETEYRIVRKSGVEAQFTTGVARDETAPRFDSVSSTAGGNADLCEASVGAQLAFSGVADPESRSFAVWAELELEDGPDTVRVFSPYGATAVRVGHSDSRCFGGTDITSLQAGNYPTRARLRDAAGNASEWQELTLQVAAEEPGGCGMMGGAAGAGGSGFEPRPDAAKVESSGCGIGAGSSTPGGGWPALGVLAAVLGWRRPGSRKRPGSTSRAH